MPLDAVGLRDAMISNLLELGIFDRVNAHEPKNAVGKGLSCATWLDSVTPIPGASGLDAVAIRVTFQVRLYCSLQRQPYDAIETDMLDAASQVFNAYVADFELNGAIKNVDLLGMNGQALSCQLGYVDQDARMFRTATISVPMIINDLYPEVP